MVKIILVVDYVITVVNPELIGGFNCLIDDAHIKRSTELIGWTFKFIMMT